jgi:hypothetical protein
MMLRKIHYAEWDAKYTAVLNSSVVIDFIINSLLDIFFLIVSPNILQYIYYFPKTRYLLSGFIILILLILRYYFLQKNKLDIMDKYYKGTSMDKGYLLFIITVCTLVCSFAVLFFIAQYVKSKGIIFG